MRRRRLLHLADTSPEYARHVQEEIDTCSRRLDDHGIPIKTRDDVKKRAKGHRVLEEPRIRTPNGLYKPDLLVITSDQAHVIDAQVINEHYDLNKAHQTKSNKYKTVSVELRELSERPRILFGSATLNWKGLWSSESSSTSEPHKKTACTHQKRMGHQVAGNENGQSNGTIPSLATRDMLTTQLSDSTINHGTREVWELPEEIWQEREQHLRMRESGGTTEHVLFDCVLEEEARRTAKATLDGTRTTWPNNLQRAALNAGRPEWWTALLEFAKNVHRLKVDSDR
ncbi:hypothetical protein CBL_12122 [Carabus blaptoides fortunei]